MEEIFVGWCYISRSKNSKTSSCSLTKRKVKKINLIKFSYLTSGPKLEIIKLFSFLLLCKKGVHGMYLVYIWYVNVITVNTILEIIENEKSRWNLEIPEIWLNPEVWAEIYIRDIRCVYAQSTHHLDTLFYLHLPSLIQLGAFA